VKKYYFETFPICQPGVIDTYGALKAAIFLLNVRREKNKMMLMTSNGNDIETKRSEASIIRVIIESEVNLTCLI